ncbi:MAG: HD domain-containing protein [Candidatus Shapirobacteria bacterium]
MKSITNLDLSKYEKMYDNFDGGHDRKHFISVRKLAVSLAKKYAPDKIELAYIAATLHDIGLSVSRKNHELNGEKLIKKDKYLKTNLSKDDFKELCHAIRQHRASTGNPKTIVAKIVSDSDRNGGSNSSPQALIRSYNYGLKEFPGLSQDEQLLESAKHQMEKFSKGSYGRRTYFPETEERLDRICDPIISAYKKQDLKYLRSLVKSLVK